MRRVKRTALIVKPKQPYIDWANALDEGGVKLDDEFTPEHTIYLVEEIIGDLADVDAIIASHFAIIFEEELNDWHRVERDWPVNRNLFLFQTWFDVEVPSLVLDLGRGRLQTERYERY